MCSRNVVTKMPAPTTLATPSVVRLNVSTSAESRRPRSTSAWSRTAPSRPGWRVAAMTGMIPAVGDARISAHGGARTEDGFVARERERRLAKLDALASQGITPYPVRYDRDTAVGELRGRFAGLEPGAETDTSARLAGRVLLIRRHGGLVFADVHDQTGTIQLLASRDDLGAGAHARFAQLDRGDWIGVEGSVMATRRGELSLRVRDFALLSKALRALPDKHLDRLVMLIAGAEAIRDVILFPAMRPEERVGERASHAGLSSERVPSAATLAAQAHEAASADGAAPGEAAPGEAGRAGHAAAAARASAPLARAATVALPRPGTVRLLAWLTALAGVFSLLPLLPVLRDSLGLVDDDLLSSSGRAAAHVATVLIGLLLIHVAPQLARRKRRAWVVALVLFAAGAALHVLKGPDPLAVLAAVAMLVALVWFRVAFFARGDPASLLSVLRFVPTYLAAVLAFGVVSLLIEQDKVSPGLTVGGVLRTVFGGLVGLNGPYTYSGPFFDDFFGAALLALGIAGLAITCVLVFRSVTQGNAPSVADRDRARELVRRYGSDTLAPFALRSDNSYFFASDGEAMIAYSFVAGYALVAADPVGAPASVPLVLDEFLGFCRARAWHVAFLAVREADLPLYRRYGFTSVYLGDEAIIRCDSFTLEGAAMKQARAAVKRVGRDHHFRLVRATDASPALRAQLNEMRERWRGKAPERGFTMELGCGVKGEDPDFLLALALDHDERPVGFLRLVPCYGDDPGSSLDLMQREPDAPNGVTEFLIANAALALGERGFRRLSMNFAAWGRLFDSSASLSFPQRALKAVAEALNPFLQIKSLRDFNEKFAPAWLPRSIVIEDPSAMARVGLLYASVEGFLTLPVVGRYLVPPLRSDAG